ncbi:MAG: hypothetical protein AAGE61_22830 [Pseudomonadota bacterium]
MAAENGAHHASPTWFVSPGESDFFAWLALALIAVAIYGVFYLYAMFDRWAEHSSKGTPLAKTIPTMLTIALLYEIFPLSHFNILLPLSAILIALMADWTNFRFGKPSEDAGAEVTNPANEPSTQVNAIEEEPAAAEPTPEVGGMQEEPKNA